MNLGRRTLFFLGVVVTCLLLVPATPAEFRWVNYSMAGLALFWAVMVGFEDLSMRREVARRGARRGSRQDRTGRGPGTA
ncbi:MAG: hypothetical protein ACE14W_10350 [Candidatus Velamenicoccus archaeovorus]